MFRFPDIYKVGVSVAPVPDQKLYDTIYQERYMGLPQENTEGYRIGLADQFCGGLKGRLLVVHGSGDDNVHYQGTERLVNRLVELGKPFDLMVYPNRTHSIAEGPGTTPHVYQLIARYFWQHLPPPIASRSPARRNAEPDARTCHRFECLAHNPTRPSPRSAGPKQPHRRFLGHDDGARRPRLP